MALSLEDVYRYIDEFDESGFQISSISAQTGTGKSTVFPLGFYKSDKSIFVVQPTITASLGIANYMKRFIPEKYIGTAVEGNINYKNEKLYMKDSSTTPLVYCTAGHLRNILLKFAEKGKSSAFVDYIFLDEAHTGDLQYDTIMYIFEYLRKKNLELPKLLLITATPGIYPFPENVIYKANYPGANKPVEITYHHRDYPKLKGKDYNDIFIDVTKVVIQAHINEPLEEDEIDSWLIFCPGKNEISSVVEELQSKTHGTIIIPLYGTMQTESEIQYDMDPPAGFRKIVVATNVAEASITIDGLSQVFDTLVEKITIQNKNGATMLVATNISKSSAQQRKGRAGRTREGKCYRMCTENYFENNLELVRKREIERIAPDGLILDLMSRHLDIEKIVVDGAISIQTQRASKKRLSTIGLINDEETDVTQAGNWIKKTPLSPRSGMFFWLWSKYSEFNGYIGAIFTAILESHNGGYFYISEEDPPIDKVLLKKYPDVVARFVKSDNKNSLYFNIALILHIIKTFKTIDIPPRELKYFCAENYLNNAKIKECFKLIKYLCLKSVKNFPIIVGDFDIDNEINKSERFLYQCFSDLTFEYGASKRHKITSEVDTFMSNKDEISRRSIVIPLSFFDTEHKTFVSMYHVIQSSDVPNFKIAF